MLEKEILRPEGYSFIHLRIIAEHHLGTGQRAHQVSKACPRTVGPHHLDPGGSKRNKECCELCPLSANHPNEMMFQLNCGKTSRRLWSKPNSRKRDVWSSAGLLWTQSPINHPTWSESMCVLSRVGLWDSMDCSLPGSFVYAFPQNRCFSRTPLAWPAAKCRSPGSPVCHTTVCYKSLTGSRYSVKIVEGRNRQREGGENTHFQIFLTTSPSLLSLLQGPLLILSLMLTPWATVSPTPTSEVPRTQSCPSPPQWTRLLQSAPNPPSGFPVPLSMAQHW